MKKIEKSIEIGGKTLTLSTGGIAEQATSAVMARYGDTVVLATVVAAPLREYIGYFPLTIEYQERLYAGGRIKGSRWVKREGRPTDDEILTARLIDRTVRPLFSEDYNNKDVQVVVTVLSVDMENSPDIVSAMAVNTALTISEIPWQGPVSTLRVGRKDGKFVVNPTETEKKESDLDLIVSSTDEAVIMIEAGANQISETDLVSAIEFANSESKPLNKLLNEFAKEVGKKKESITKNPDKAKIVKEIEKIIDKTIDDTLLKLAKKEIGYPEFDLYKASVFESLPEYDYKTLNPIFEGVVREHVRKLMLSGKRVDGRASDELRELSAQVEVLPRVHGSAIFQRGQTQVMSVVTLAPPSLELLIETAEGEESRRYMHHYSMPPYSVGETGRMGSPSRREIGHGALAERAILPVLPENGSFPYTIRVVSEVLSSNGSTSMASTCGSTLSLMDAGVPIKAPVAGIAMGLVVESEKKFVVLTDITGLEDGNGDMDFKVAGTKDGITALQLDVKTQSLTVKILKDALTQAKTAREKILDVITTTIAEPRKTVSTHAPKIKTIKINPEKIGELIGPGGKMIKSIIAETGAQVDVEDDGTVNVSGITDEEVNAAYAKVEAITKEIVAGEIYEGVVKRLESFGAFVEIAPGRDGLVHVSDMSTDYVKNPADLVKIGDKFQVRVKEIDNLGRINLSMILDPALDKKERPQRENRDSGGRGRPQRRDFGRGRRRESSGPHFPASRFLDPKKGNFTR